MRRSLVLALLVSAVVVNPVSAARVTVAVEADGAQFGDTVLVTATGNSDSQVWVRVGCYTNGALVLDAFAYVGSSPGVYGSPFITLANDPYWTSGGADCVAQMWDSRRWRPMPNVTDEFSVLP